MGKKSFGVYLDEDRVAAATAGRVSRDFKGNFSAYMDDLLKRDVENAPPPLGEKSDVILELARHYHPTLVDELAAALKGRELNQPRAIMRTLDAILEAINRGVDVTRAFGVFNSESQMNAFIAAQPRGPEFIHQLRNLVETFGPGELSGTGETTDKMPAGAERAKNIHANDRKGRGAAAAKKN